MALNHLKIYVVKIVSWCKIIQCTLKNIFGAFHQNHFLGGTSA